MPGQITHLYRINSGGADFTDNESNQWEADATNSYFTGGNTSSKSFNVAGTTDDLLYLNYRFSNNGAPFSYALPVGSAGPFTVKLHFLEPYFGVNGPGGSGRRVFNVDIENGQGALNNFDINADTGPASAVVKTFGNIMVSDGVLNIEFSSVVDNAIVSAIEVQSSGAPALEFAATPNNIQLNQGTNGSIGNFLSTNNGTDPLTATLNAVDVNQGGVPSWLRVNNSLLNNVPFTSGAEVSFQFDATGLAVGNYVANVTASANGYSDAVIQLTMTVTDPAGLRPYIVGVYDGNNLFLEEGATDVPLDINISTVQIIFASNIPDNLKGLDENTVIPSNVRLVRVSNGATVSANVNSTGGGDAITLVPTSFLEANTQYRLEITDAVQDLNGSAMIPFSITFTTGTEISQPGTNLTGVAFEKVQLPNTVDPTGLGYASLTIGPDGKL
ncbi:MAG: malectin domain-containing carbohydrate-binding protein, partial [Bacteroidota bacterium]